MDKTSRELLAEKKKLVDEAEALQAKYRTNNTLAEDESARLDECITLAESLNSEITNAQRCERLAIEKAKLDEPTRPAPKLAATYKRTEPKPVTASEAMSGFIRARAGEPLSDHERFRLQEAGIDLSTDSLKMAFDWDGLNPKKFRTLATDTSPGSKAIFQTYSDQVKRYIAQTSQILTVLDTEHQNHYNDRTFVIVDDTANESSDITASGGTETAPHIPDKDMDVGLLKLKPKTITSGYQKFTRQELASSIFRMEGEAAMNDGIRHARKMERDVVAGTGNGVTDVEGILQSSTSAGNLTGGTWTEPAIDSFLLGIPPQYRPNVCFVVSNNTYADMRHDLRDGIDRSLFDSAAQEGIEYTLLKNKKVFVSAYMDDDILLAFDPQWYKLLLVDEVSFDVLRDKFHPLIAYCGLMAFTGGWRGPSVANQYLTLTS